MKPFFDIGDKEHQLLLTFPLPEYVEEEKISSENLSYQYLQIIQSIEGLIR